MNPKFKLNFSYGAPPPANYSAENSRLNRSTVASPAAVPSILRNGNVSYSEQKVRTPTLYPGQDVFRESPKIVPLEPTKQPLFRPFDVQPQKIYYNVQPQVKTARQLNEHRRIEEEVDQTGLKRNDFSTMRLRITQGQEELEKKRLKTEGQNPLHHSVANLQGERFLDQKVSAPRPVDKIYEQKDDIQEQLQIEQKKRLQLEQKLQQMSRKCASVLNNQAKAKNPFERIESQVFEEEKGKYLQAIQQKQRKITELQLENEEKDSALDQAATRIFMLSQQLQQKAQNSQQVLLLKKKVTQLELSLRRETEEVKRLKLTIEHDSRYKILQHDFTKLKAKAQNYQSRIETVSGQLDNMNAFIQDFKIKNQKTLTQMITDVAIMDEFRLKNQELEEIKQILNKKQLSNTNPAEIIKRLEGEINRLKMQNDQLSKKIEQKQKNITQVLQNSQNQKNNLTQKLQKLTEQFNSKDRQINILLTQISQLKDK